MRSIQLQLENRPGQTQRRMPRDNRRSAHDPSDARTITSTRSSRHGFFLVECMVYMVVFVMVLGLAFSLFYRTLSVSGDLNRISSDIIRTLHAGESWRDEIRAAIEPPRVVEETGHAVLAIPRREGVVAYTFTNGAVWRQAAPDYVWKLFLADVRTSRMEPDARGKVTAWTWEVELKSRKRLVRVPPLFSFTSVAGTQTKP